MTRKSFFGGSSNDTQHDKDGPRLYSGVKIGVFGSAGNRNTNQSLMNQTVAE